MTDQALFTIENYSDIDHISKLLDQFGVAIIPKYLKNGDLRDLLAEFHDFTDTDDTEYKKSTPYSSGKCIRVDRPKINKKRFPKTEEVFSSDFMRKLTDEFWSPDAFLNKEIFIAKDIKGTKHVANELHFDIMPTFKFFLYLTDTTVENGAFSCVPGSHKLSHKIRIEKGDKISFSNREESRDLPVDKDDIVPIEGKAGSLIIFTTETFHKAGIVSKGERLIMRGHCRTKEQEMVGLEKPSKLSKIKNKLLTFIGS